MIASSLVVPSFFLGSSLVFYKGEIGKVQGKEILINVLFLLKVEKIVEILRIKEKCIV